MLDPRRLETFRVVATTGRISAAARQLHLSQPAVTAQIRQLEEECGRALFTRSPRGMALNAAGHALLEYAQKIHALLDEATTSLQAEEELSGELAIAASTTIAAYVLPSLLVEFRRVHPSVDLRLEVGNTTQVLEWVNEERVPLGMVEGHGRAAGVRLEAFLADEIVPTVAASAPAELSRIDRIADLEDVPILWREPGSGTRAVVERGLRKAGSRRRSRKGDLQFAHTEAIKAAAALGAGLAFLSRWSIHRELESGRLRVLAIRDLHLARTFSWVTPVAGAGGLVGRFMRFAKENPPRLGG